MEKWFLEASYLLKRIEENGFEAYYVGGCVRDFVLNKPIKDIDIASNAKPKDIQRIFPKTIPVGIEHGTVIVRYNHISYEVTTFRKEGTYHDYRRPSEVWFVDSLTEDLARRDFTFNAMAMDKKLNLLDPFCGKNDLANRIIRTVGSPNERFSEDPLRLMRACRFMSVYELTMESDTKKAIYSNAHLLARISTERVATEFKKMLEGKNAGCALNFMKGSGLFSFLPYPLQERKENTLENVQWTSLETEAERWATIILLCKVDSPKDFLKKWKLPNSLSQDVLTVLSAFHHDRWSKMDLYRIGLSAAVSGLRIQKAIEPDFPFEKNAKELAKMADRIPIHKRNELPITGEEIMKLKQKPPGIWLGELFNNMEEAVVEGELSPRKEDLVEWAKRWGQ